MFSHARQGNWLLSSYLLVVEGNNYQILGFKMLLEMNWLQMTYLVSYSYEIRLIMLKGNSKRTMGDMRKFFYISIIAACGKLIPVKKT